MVLDDDQCWGWVLSRDPRRDGTFVMAVHTTGIYCRPSCPAVTPRRVNVSFHRTSAAAQAAGFRACKRCRPDATPGSPEWNVRGDVVGRAMSLIADGIVDRDGVTGLCDRLGYGERQLQRILLSEVGATPVALARAQRAQTARLLVETTDLPMTDVAFAAGFGSVRQFNDTMREVFAAAPRDLRTGAGRRPAAGGAGVTVRLAHREPLDRTHLLDFLSLRAVPGVEAVEGATYTRSLRLPGGPAVVSVTFPVSGPLTATFRLAALGDLQAGLHRVRLLLDLDADPVAVDAHLVRDGTLAQSVAARPGVRSPGHPDGAELVTRAVLGQQVSVAGARTLAARLVAAHGDPLPEDLRQSGVDMLFPRPEVVAGLCPGEVAIPASRLRALADGAAALAEGRVVLDVGADRDAARESLLRVRGIGPWTADYVRMRALADPDVMLATDLGVRHGLARLGATDVTGWSPWRSYAVHRLWLAASGAPAPADPPPTDRSPT